MIYFDQAATSYPKPKEVVDAVVKTMNNIGANPGRSGHRLQRDAAQIIMDTRRLLAELFGCSNANHSLFFQNATVALNQAIKGFTWKKGDHVIATSLEHNSVRRSIEYVKNEYDVEASYITWKFDEQRLLDDFRKTIQQQTKVLIMTHACNVTGQVLPLKEMLHIAKENDLITIVDGSQTAGHIPINMNDAQIDMLAFPGHKGLLAPQGIGMLLVNGNHHLNPIHHGGTGAYSEVANQPDEWPYKYESGTLNTPAIAGLQAALTIYERELDKIVSRETILMKQVLKGLRKIKGITIYEQSEGDIQLPITAFNVKDVSSQEIAIILDSHYDIAVRAGLHCNPLSHETHDTLNQGMIRVSLNKYNTEHEIKQFLNAIEEIVTSYNLIS